MKKLCAVVFLFAAGIVFTAVWFSPLAALGTPVAYSDNIPITRLDGLCYSADSLVRVDFTGGEEAMYSALDRIGAQEVERAETGELLVVYAYSPRVCAKPQELRSGCKYNVMCACSGDAVSIGTPILSGCY
ncbi:MAG: hypothetical protein J1G01_06970 [Clostridiales bacterium]|nr:hypothetical protein [Clostridiales bacterium]